MTYRTAQQENPELALNGSVTLADIKVADRTGAPFLAATRLDTEITRASFLAREFDLSSFSVDGLEVFLTRDNKGVFSHSRLGSEASPGAAPRRKVLVNVKEARLRNGRFHFIDSLPPGGFTTDLEGIALDMRDYSTSPGKRASYALFFATLRGEKGRLQGEFSPRPLATVASIELNGVMLEAYSPYLAALLPAKVKGRCDIAGNLDFGGPEGMRLEKVFVQGRQLSVPIGRREKITMAALSLNGGKFSQKEQRLEVAEITLKDGVFHFSRERSGARLLPLNWERLQLDRLQWNFAPFALVIDAVALNRFDSQIIVAKDGSPNPQQLSPRKQGGEEPERVAKKGERMIRIGMVTMQDGTLTFTDHHVAGGYSTTLYNLGGRISGLSAAEKSLADVDLRGTLEKHSPLRITGQINPLRGDLFVDLKVSFTEIELSPMTPYAVTYLGYAIDKGELFLNCNCLIKNRKINLENKIRIDQLDFGQRIESDKAISSSVRLAVALLKDRKGEIHLDLPVTGRTDDPHFTVRHLVYEIVQNLLTTAEAAPFSLLPSLSGRQEDWSSVGFASGSAELSPGEREKLLRLATALNDRPELKIKVVGFVDRTGDAEGFRNEVQLRRLAEARAVGVMAFLVEQGKMEAARLLLVSGDIDRAPTKGGAGSRVVFEVVVDI